VLHNIHGCPGSSRKEERPTWPKHRPRLKNICSPMTRRHRRCEAIPHRMLTKSTEHLPLTRSRRWLVERCNSNGDTTQDTPRHLDSHSSHLMDPLEMGHPHRILTTSAQHLPMTGRHRRGWLVQLLNEINQQPTTHPTQPCRPRLTSRVST
jgi:hypothetical protein